MISIELVGLDELRHKLNKMTQALDSNEILDEATALLLNRTRRRFLRAVDPDNIPWKPSVRAMLTGGKTLYDTGTLFHSIQAFTTGPNERSIGTDVFYGRYHQFGDEGRSFLGFNDQDLFLAESIVLRRVAEAVA